ncbi:hypothetical protein BUALT_Bualt16G0023500 [Buddleja alternifolia]|uniref:Recombination activating protein 1 n=1 Tax=Buddleja alternifolia TaxID=168488 RepID=A0AAV6WA70_9LAMI|nr:hypothetical protein BUALT_Bualt16G0023500 [Buddleja alternifolia]
MSSSKSNRKGPPKHANKFAWVPNAGVKINPTVRSRGKIQASFGCNRRLIRCKEQIDWKRRYGKYKPLAEPSKCQWCSKRNVRQAYHNLCNGCAKEHMVCAKCSCRVDKIIGRDISEVEAEQKTLGEVSFDYCNQECSGEGKEKFAESGKFGVKPLL